MDSPPLSRGAHGVERVEQRPRGLTPALAGSTHARHQPSTTHGTHPRSRGEHGVGSFWSSPSGDSPPLSRGAPRDAAAQRGLEGLTPALAGSTGDSAHRGFLSGTHPRSRGEHAPSIAIATWRVDSPPLSRGARRCAISRCGKIGLTPALAGSTRTRSLGILGSRTHPRSRGEHSGTHVGKASARDSPPLSRGAPGRSCRVDPGPGLTPALAGSTTRLCPGCR